MCMFLMPDPCLAEDSCPIVRERTVQGGHVLKIYRTQSTVSVVVDVIGIIPSHLDHPEKHGPLEEQNPSMQQLFLPGHWHVLLHRSRSDVATLSERPCMFSL